MTEISIHALLAESDRRRTYQQGEEQAFLSTLSLRRATISCAWSASKFGDFYPRSPCGERQLYDTYAKVLRVFLSTLSLRRATTYHFMPIIGTLHFYPRSPCGERLDQRCKFSWDNGFLSTLSLRRATLNGFAMRWNTCISIHALLAESDICECWMALNHL